MKTQEKAFTGIKLSGFLAATIMVALGVVGIFLMMYQTLLSAIVGAVLLGLACAMIPGFVIIEPNMTRVMLFFGRYKGTMTDNGFYWTIPLYDKTKISLRARNLEIKPIKVNDKMGNPIMIGAVLVWRIKDTYKSVFDIDGGRGAHSAYNFVMIQSDAALRQVAGAYAYDDNEKGAGSITLRSDGDEVSQKLESELNSRLQIAGIEVIEARINYLAYASEIASVMLRRQQADAIIAAREKIVEGAVGMVQLALDKLKEDNIVELDDERKAAMVSNLLVVLCADEAAQPVINAGTLHH